MNNHVAMAAAEESIYPLKRISWSAIIVGALVGVGLGFLLNVFGMAIGLKAFSTDDTGAMALTIGGVLGLLIGVIVSMLAAGYAAGYLGRYYVPKRNLGIVYGFCTWSLALILSAVLAGHVTNYVVVYAAGATQTGLVSDRNVNTRGLNAFAGQGERNQAPSPEANQITPSAEDLAWSAFIVFVLFFIGAVSTCFGAAWGMSSLRED